MVSHSNGTTLGSYTEKCLVQAQHEMISENGTAGMQEAHSWGGGREGEEQAKGTEPHNASVLVI